MLISAVKLKGKRLKRRWMSKRKDYVIDTEMDAAGNECVKFLWVLK